jgi:hypothetical protein
MPQFDSYTFFQQTLMTVFFINVFYFFYIKFFVVIFSKMYKIRSKLNKSFFNTILNESQLEKKTLFF